MKKTNILDFFKTPIPKVLCPVCGISIVKSSLNAHLDSQCSSALPITVSSNIETGKNNKKLPVPQRKATATSSRLCLKSQRSKIKSKNKTNEYNNGGNGISSDDEIVIVDEIKPTFSKLSHYREEDSFKSVEVNGNVKDMCSSTDSLHNKDSRTSSNEVYTSNDRVLPSVSGSHDKTNQRETNDYVSNNRTSLKRKKSSENQPKLLAKARRSNYASSKPKKLRGFNTVSKVQQSNSSKELDDSNSPTNGSESKTDAQNISADKKNAADSEITSCNEEKSDSNAALVEKKLFTEEVDFSELSDSGKKKDTKPYAPYYIANFKYILENVINDQYNQNLFNNEDKESITAFKSASDAAQKIYVRLFQRKYKWLRIYKINYPDITQDPFKALEELVKAGLVDSGALEIELDVALELLSLPEAKSLSKHFNFNSTKSKSEIKQQLLKHCKEHKSVFFTNCNNGVSGMILKKVRSILGPCYRISLLPKRLFTRILMLFSLPTISEDDDEAAGGQQQQLITLLQVNKGELVFPACKKKRETVIFCDRDELIRYEEARQLENDIYNAVESKNFDLAKELSINAKELFDNQTLCSFSKRASSLPPFLKRYTSFHVYIRCMTQGVEALQKLRQYGEAVTLLKKLLKQTVYCQDYKGRWYDRLALNLEQHLKKRESALKAIKQGLEDKYVRIGHRYSLLTRGLRITKSFDDEDEFKKQLIQEATIREAPKVTIQGRLCPRSILGRRHVFVSSSVSVDEEDVTVLGVEQVALEHYKDQGFTEGIHGEGSTFISLYALLFWDIIYDDNIPDAFIGPHQTHPLDLNSEAFFKSREGQITSHLKQLRQSTKEELNEIIKSTWTAHQGKASLISWDRFSDLEHVQSLASCLGSQILSGICERLSKDFRFTRSGVPDLVVWNPENLCAKIVEVKGPGDKLSAKQILWLDHLIKIGAAAEVCLVEAVTSKKLWK